jgi:tetratricopeptide (TPR) repeat protein
MINIIQKILIAALLVGSTFSFASIEPNTESVKSVPKGLDDIVRLINETKVDFEVIKKSIHLIEELPKENSSKTNLLDFYYLQSVAAERLGRADKKVFFLKKALENADSRERFAIINELASAEINIGNPAEAIDKLKKIQSQIPLRGNGTLHHLSENYAILTKALLKMGDINAAERVSLEASSLKFSTGTIKQDWAWRWNGSYYQTIGDLYFYKGKYDEADIAYQYAIASLDSGVSSYDKNYNHQGVAGSSFEQGNSPDYIKGLIEELLREKSEVLIHLRKINEAEKYSREDLKRSLARTGQASTSSSSSIRQLAIVMLARDRNKDAVFLLNQALLGLKDAGVSEDATQFSKTKKLLYHNWNHSLPCLGLMFRCTN